MIQTISIEYYKKYIYICIQNLRAYLLLKLNNIVSNLQTGPKDLCSLKTMCHNLVNLVVLFRIKNVILYIKATKGFLIITLLSEIKMKNTCKVFYKRVPLDACNARRHCLNLMNNRMK